ncbi:MAG: O-antigen ligase family protein [Isosphaeraceae bacterium]
MVAFYMALFLVRPWEVLFPWMAEFPVERTFAILTIAAVFLGGRFWFQFTGQAMALLGFLTVVILSAPLGLDTQKSMSELYKYMTVVIWFWLLNSVIRTPRDLLAMNAWWMFVWFFYMAKAFWEFKVNGRHDWAQGVPRMKGIDLTYGDVNEFAGCVTFTLPTFYAVFRARGEFDGWIRKAFVLAGASYLLLAVACVISTNSRSGMAKTIAFFLLASTWRRSALQKLAYLAGSVGLLMIIWAVMPEGSQNRFRTLWDKDAGNKQAMESASSRFEGLGFQIGCAAVLEFPVTGVGIGNFGTYRKEYYDGEGGEAHNLAGQVLGETGVLGTIAFVAMVCVMLAGDRRIRAVSRLAGDRRLAMLSDFSLAYRDTILLLFVSGVAGHNLFFYHWVWMAAFSQCAVRCLGAIQGQRSDQIAGAGGLP